LNVLQEGQSTLTSLVAFGKSFALQSEVSG
jgi:hypothetical protein